MLVPLFTNNTNVAGDVMNKTENLFLLMELLKNKNNESSKKIYIPEEWNHAGYMNFETDLSRKGELLVNAYDFISFNIEQIIKQSYEHTNKINKNNICNSTIYSMYVRMFTAWNHYEGENIIGGTFLKSICLLPYLKKLGTDIIYLLPVFEHSVKYKKGEKGSPYAIKNIYKLDPELHDDLIGQYSEEVLNLQFKAFVEACHVLGIKVMLDFVFRTVSRDSDLIKEHPDWFYWIDLKYNDDFSTPIPARIKKPAVINENTMKYLYKSKQLNDYLSKFTYSPEKIDRKRWQNIVKLHEETGQNILDLIEKEYGITTVPGFSDVLNDMQPPWTDVTYLKFYFEISENAKKYINHCDDMPPYIMQDGVCLNVNSGEIKNEGLWDYTIGVIPYYQNKFKIDGARIDMGHALPGELKRAIISRVKEINKDFILWSEEFNPEKSEDAKKDGFHFISGYTWAIYKEFEKSGFNKKLLNNMLLRSAIPVTAALETPDTPRAALRFCGKDKLHLLIMLNYFIPNAAPFINNGMELLEKQPMNLGLDNSEEGKYVLDKNDRMYGKLAFFDGYQMHWLNEERLWMKDILINANALRNKFTNLICDNENYINISEIVKNKKLTVLCYYNKLLHKGLVFAANRSLTSKAKLNLDKILQSFISDTSEISNIYVAYPVNNEKKQSLLNTKKIYLLPGEVNIYYF